MITPTAWIKRQRSLMGAGEVWERQQARMRQRMADAFHANEMVVAFAPIAKYIDMVAQAGVQVASYGPDGLEKVVLERVAKNAVGYQVKFETERTGGQTQEAWGFGVSVFKRRLGVGFEVYDFGGGHATGGVEMNEAKEALQAFMTRVEEHAVAIEAPNA